MKYYKLTIPGTLPDYNQEIEKAKGGDKFGVKYRKFKETTDRKICWLAAQQLRGVKIEESCAVLIRWYCKDKRKDQDNICFAKKYIFDGLQDAGIIKNDGWANIGGGFMDQFAVDKENPRVEIYLMPGMAFEFDPESDFYD